MALEETDELVLKHSATGSEQTTHQFQSFYVKHTDDKGETHYIPVEFHSVADVLAEKVETGDPNSLKDYVGFIVKRDRQES